MRRTSIWCTFVAAIGFVLVVHAEDPCAGFKWPVDPERKVFESTATAVTAGGSKDAAVALDIGQLYDLALAAADTVDLAVSPSKKTLTDGDHAGLAQFSIAEPGTYRVSLDAAFWVEIVHDGAAVTSHDFSGSQGCAAPRKIVEYQLPAAGIYLLQLSGATADRVRVAVTRVSTNVGQ